MVFLLAFAISFIFHSLAHSETIPQGLGHPNGPNHWYGRGCCSDRDCEAIPAAAVHEIREGYFVEYMSLDWGHVRGIILHRDVLPSQDIYYHGCARPQVPISGVRCLYIPMMM